MAIRSGGDNMFAGDWLASRLINQILLGVFVVLTLVTPQFAEKILGMAVYIALLQYCRDLPLDRRVITASFWLLAAFAVAVIFSYNTYVSSVFLSVYASYFVLMVVAAVFIDSREKLTGVCTFLAVAVILIDCYALWQFISGENTSLIGVVGEIFCRLNQFANADLIRLVEEQGGECWLADIAELLTAYTMGRTRRAIRNMLSVGEETGKVDEIVLAAPAHVLHDIREGLDKAATGKLGKCHSKDLTNTPDGELASHFH